MKEFWDDIGKYLTLMIIIVFFLIWGITFAAYKYSVEVANANIIKIEVDGVQRYIGKSAFVDVSSGGMTTSVTIYKKLYPFRIVEKQYSNNNVEVDSDVRIFY